MSTKNGENNTANKSSQSYNLWIDNIIQKGYRVWAVHVRYVS